ncbi:MAG: LssY C-terminal domain-containing protein [Gammaproteobacteria bacterium]
MRHKPYTEQCSVEFALRSCRRCAPILACAIAAGCATTFEPAPVGNSPFVSRAITQSVDGISIAASVLSTEEFAGITGIDVEDHGIQPLWLSVENENELPVRVAYSSIDSDYYSPLEVAWAYRKDFRKRSRDDLDLWFYETRLPRGIPAGDTRSGFVYTHATEGTKGFNVDVYTTEDSAQFTFFLPLPGFRPDYMDVEFTSLYEEDEILHTDREGMRAAVETLPCCTTDESGEAEGDPLSIVLVGSGEAIRRSLLRGGWNESESGSPLARVARSHRFLGRQPDGTFFNARPDGSERKELRLWLAPMIVDDAPVWVGTASYEMSGNLGDPEATNLQIDPDIDDARMFVVQNLWYAQSLAGFALAKGMEPVQIDAPRSNFLGDSYFTDGNRAVLFVSEQPVGMDETEIIFWEPFLGR